MAQAKVDLNLVKGCCTHQLRLKGAISPFRRAIALEYGEESGPVVGVAMCAQCSRCSKFVLVGEQESLRAYSIAPLPDNSLASLEAGYSKVRKPSWPIWVPPTPDQIKIGDRTILDHLEETVLAKAGVASYVIITKHLINGRILGTAPYVPTGNWFQNLGDK